MKRFPQLCIALAVAAAVTLAGLFAAPGASSAARRAERPPTAERGPIAGPVDAEVLKIVDGDTLTVRAHVWVGQSVETNVRLDGIDTPELHARCADERAKAEAARALVRTLVADRRVRLHDVESDKYGGRVRARVRTTDGTDIADALVRAGLARPYHGEHRRPWCGA